MKIEIRNGRVIDPAQGIDRVCTLYIVAGNATSQAASTVRDSMYEYGQTMS